MRVGILTTSVLPEPDADQTLLEGALRDAGIDWLMLPWDQPPADLQQSLAGLSLVLIRSPWDYYRDPTAFLEVLELVRSQGLPLVNPLEVLAWNLDKHYLEKLRAQGIAVVPTQWLRPGDAEGFRETEGVWVIKPAISCGSWRTGSFRAEDPVQRDKGRRHAEELLGEGRAVMVQPFVAAVAEGRERCAVFIGGQYSHAVAKRPRFADDEESVSKVDLSAAEIAFCEQVLDASGWASSLHYGRVDFFAEGRELVLSELELLEPSLFFRFHPEAAGRLIEALRSSLLV